MARISYRIFTALGRRHAEFRNDDTGALLGAVDMLMQGVVVRGGQQTRHPLVSGKASIHLPMPRDEALKALEATGFRHRAEEDDDPTPVFGQTADAAEPAATGRLIAVPVPYPAPQYTPAVIRLADQQAVSFNIGTRRGVDGSEISEAVIMIRDADGEWIRLEDEDIVDLPDCLDLISPSRRFPVRSSLAEAKATLMARGFRLDPELFLWHTPSEIDYIIEAVEDGEFEVFFLPRDEDSPVFDSLCDSDLSRPPSFITQQTSENTFTLDPAVSPDEARRQMDALGYHWSERLRVA